MALEERMEDDYLSSRDPTSRLFSAEFQASERDQVRKVFGFGSGSGSGSGSGWSSMSLHKIATLRIKFLICTLRTNRLKL